MTGDEARAPPFPAAGRGLCAAASVTTADRVPCAPERAPSSGYSRGRAAGARTRGEDTMEAQCA